MRMIGARTGVLSVALWFLAASAVSAQTAFIPAPASPALPLPPAPPVLQPGASIVLTTPSGAAGDAVSVAVTLQTQGAVVAGIQNDIGFDLGAPIVATTDDRPDCTVNPAINKPATSFAFRCVHTAHGADCRTVRAIVVAVDNVDPISDGTLLYTCAVRIGDETPPGSYRLAVSGEIASDPDGNQIPFTGVDGAVVVITAPGVTPLPTWTVSPTPSPEPPTATYTPFPTSTRTPTDRPTHTPRPSVAVSVGAATAGPGDSVALGVTLTSGAYPVAAVQADVILDPGIAIAATLNGKPDCAVNADINKQATAFSFLPFNCQPGVSCTGMRALVLAVDNVDPIPDGAVLYTCRVQVDSHAPPAMYRVLLLYAVASDPTGEAWNIVLNNGEIDVFTPPGATPIPTWTPGQVVVEVPPSPPESQAGQACDPTDVRACESGFCVDAMCCDSASCPDPRRCDIFGFEGTCVPPQPEGAACQKQTDCEHGLDCQFDPVANAFRCLTPPLPTPTFIPFAPQPTPLSPSTNLVRSDGGGGGCSTTPARQSSSGFWLLLLVPAIQLWRRRIVTPPTGAGARGRAPERVA